MWLADWLGLLLNQMSIADRPAGIANLLNLCCLHEVQCQWSWQTSLLGLVNGFKLTHMTPRGSAAGGAAAAAAAAEAAVTCHCLPQCNRTLHEVYLGETAVASAPRILPIPYVPKWSTFHARVGTLRAPQSD